MSIIIKNGILSVSGAEDKLRQKGQERPGFFADYTMIDIETTGLRTYRDHVTELGGVKVRNHQIVARYSNLVRYPKNNEVPAFITRLNGITQEMIETEGLPVAQAISEFRDFIGDDLIAGYNVNFDLNFIYDLVERYHLPRLGNDYIDVLRLTRTMFPHQSNRLAQVMRRVGIDKDEEHHGLADSLDTIKVYRQLAANYSPELLEKAQASLKNVDLTAEPDYLQLAGRNPVLGKQIVLAGNLKTDPAELKTALTNLGGQIQSEVDMTTNFLIMGDHDFFSKQNKTLNQARTLIKSGAKIKRLSESFFLNLLADWARN